MTQYRLCVILLLLPFAAWGAGIDGQLKTTVDSYANHVGQPVEDLTPFLSLELSQKFRINRSLRTQWRLTGLGNISADGPPENFYTDLPEAFVEWKKSDFKLRLGLNTVNWGMVDIMSPSDVVNTSALFHPLRSLKQGAPMLETIIGSELLNLDLLYIPVQRRPLLPSKNSRWLPRRFLVNVDPSILRVSLPNFIEYRYLRPETLDHALNNNFGAKLASHLGSVDLQITHFEGASTMPKIRPALDLVFDNARQEWLAQSPIELAQVTYRARTSGFGFVWASERWILRGESAYSHTISSDPLLQPWSWTNVLAVETSVDLDGRAVTLLAQYYYAQNPQPPDNLPSSTYRLFDRTPLLGARWAYSDRVTVVGSLLYESITRGVLWMAGLDYKLDDHLRFGLSWRDFSAPRDGLVKTFERNDHSTIEMTYFF